MALEEAPQAFGSKLADWSGAGDTEARWRGRLESVPANFVAYLDSSPVGQASGAQTDKPGVVELISLWVAPEARGSGVGHGLIQAVQTWARTERAGSLVLWVKVDNASAISLYEREGFMRTGPNIHEGECEMLVRL
jgi:ribosomal protein S18 acetylase RimI-like enzyme